MRTWAVVAALLGLGLLAWARGDHWVAIWEQQRAEERWDAHEPAAYSFTWSGCSGMCAACVLRVSVRDGEVVRSRPVEGCSAYDRERAPTIEDVFALEEWERSSPSTDSFEIEHDPTYGFPARMSFACPEGWSDCGSTYGVSDFALRADVGPCACDTPTAGAPGCSPTSAEDQRFCSLPTSRRSGQDGSGGEVVLRKHYKGIDAAR